MVQGAPRGPAPAEPIDVAPRPDEPRSAAAPPDAASERGPILEVLGIPAFRWFLIAQFLAQLVGATLRFAFIWLALEVSDWSAASGMVAFAAGLPAMLLSLPAGVWGDRADRWRLIVGGTVAAGLLLLATGAMIALGWAGLGTAIVMSGLVGTAHAVFTPAQQAVAPMLVPRGRLTTAVALQTVGMQVAMFAGALATGAAIRELGTASAFVALAAVTLLSATVMRAVRIPPVRGAAPAGSSVAADARAGLAFVFHNEPLRSLVVAGVLIGALWGVVQINLPAISKELMDKGAFASSALLAAFAPGMLVSTLWLAAQKELRRRGLLFAIAVGVGLGAGALLIGLSRSYPLTLAIMLVWGLCGGVAMTTQRSLLQSITPDAMMGRVMGIWTLAMVGAFPLSAALSAALAPSLGSDGSVVAVALAVLVLAPVVVFRREVRRA